MKIDKKKILLVGGGTGGHILPILNLYKELKKHSAISVLVIGGTTKIDNKLYQGIDNFVPMLTGKLHRRLNIDNFFQLLYLIFGLLKSLYLLVKIKPNLVFSKAGYVSFPVIFWSKILGIPCMIHESDIEMGAANKYAASFASKIFVGFPIRFYPEKLKEKLVYTGQILRPEIVDKYFHSFDFGFKDNKPVIFITGGSQGSRNINNAIFGSLPDLLSKYNLIHHVGSLDLSKAIDIRSELSEDQKNSYFVSEILLRAADGKDLYLSAVDKSDLIISRAGATAFAELGAFKKPIIVVPYKYSASNHQLKNALFYKEAHATVVISDDDFNRETVLEKIGYLFDHSKEKAQIAENAFNLFPRDGLNKIVQEIIQFLSVKQN